MTVQNVSEHITIHKVVTDHRIGLTLQKLGQIMEGNLDEIIDALTLSEQTEKLKELNNGEL